MRSQPIVFPNRSTVPFQTDPASHRFSMAVSDWSLSFVPMGTVLDRPLPSNTVAVDVGNGEPSEGIFDHHHRATAAESAVERVLRHRALLLDRLRDQDAVCLIGHQQPDFDCLTALFLVWCLGTDPDRIHSSHISSEAWIRTVGDADQGRTALSGDLTLYSCATLLRLWLRQTGGWCGSDAETQVAKTLNVRRPLGEDDKLDRCVAVWFMRLLDVWTRRGYAPDAVLSPAAVREPLTGIVQGTQSILDTQWQRCVADHKRAQEEGNVGTLQVPTRDGDRTKAPYVRLVDPSAQAGILARTLRQWGQRTHGTPAVTVLQFSDAARTVVSVDPESRLTLRGLGRALEAMEQAERRRRGLRDDAPPRFQTVDDDGTTHIDPHFSSSDPWYDGRGHRYTIVDAPRAGSLLSLDAVYRCVIEGRWMANQETSSSGTNL